MMAHKGLFYDLEYGPRGWSVWAGTWNIYDGDTTERVAWAPERWKVCEGFASERAAWAWVKTR